MNLLKSHLDRILFSTSTSQLFGNEINLHFKSSLKACECGSHLKIYKTIKRKKYTLAFGEFTAHITQSYCEACKKIYGNEEINSIAPSGSQFGYDVIEYIGRALFIEHRGDEEIQTALLVKNIRISLREIGYIGKKFIVYLALTHQAAQSKIKTHIKSKGGYILHLDGTCEGGSPHLFSFIDEISQIVLDNIKIASENKKLIQPSLEELKKNYGDPVAVVHDMSAAIISAVESVFPDARDYICHLHFLRDLGKDLFSTEYSAVQRRLKSLKIRSALREFARNLKNYIESNQELKDCLDRCLEKNFFKDNGGKNVMAPVPLYMLVTWVLESKKNRMVMAFLLTDRMLIFTID